MTQLLNKKFFTILILSLAFASNASDGWLLAETLEIHKGTTHLVTFTNNTVDMDIKVMQKQRLISMQNGPESRSATEHIVLSAHQQSQTFSIYVRATHKTNQPLTWRVQTQQLSDQPTIAAFTLLYQASQGWFNFRESHQKHAFFLAFLKSIPPDNPAYHDAVNMSAWSCYVMEDYLCAYRLGAQLSDQSAFDHLRLKGLWLMANAKLNISRFKEAIELYSLTLHNSVNSNSPDWQLNRAEIYGYLGLAKTLLSKANGAQHIDGFTELDYALAQAYALEDDVLTSELMGLLWSYHTIKNEYPQAEAILDIAMRLLQDSDTEKGLVILLNHQAMTYEITGRLSKALKTYRKALNLLFEQNRPGTLANVYNNMAEVYTHLGDYQQASVYYSNALKTYHDIGFVYGQGVALRGLGKVARQQGDFNRATEYHQRSADVFKDNYPDDYSVVHIELGKDYLVSKNIQQAAWHAEKAAALISPQTLHQNSYSLALLEAELALINHDPHFHTILTQLDQNYGKNAISQELVLEKLRLKLEYSLLNSEYQEAHQLFQNAYSILNDVRQNIDRNLTLSWQKKTSHLVDLYIKILFKEFLQTGQGVEQIHDILENAKFIDLRERRATLKRNDQSLSEQQKAAVQRTLNNYLAIERQSIQYKPTSNNNQQYLELDQAKQSYLHTVDDLYNSREIQLSKILDITSIQMHLSEDELVIRYHLDQDITFALLIWQDGHQIIDIPSETTINKNSTAVIQQFKSHRPYQNLQEMHALSNILPIKLLHANRFTKLIIIADGILHQIPFSILNISDQADQYEPLINHYEVTRTHAMSDYFSKP